MSDMSNGTCQSPPNPPGADAAAALYERSGAAAYGLSAEQFAAILDEILRKYLPFESSAHASPE